MKILVTCPPMLGLINEFIPVAQQQGFELIPAQVTQTLSEAELTILVPQYEGWVIGDDPATRQVFTIGKAGKLKAAIKWGIGVDNVDFAACKDLNIPITNTPNMFGSEVADVALAYVIGLARQLFIIDREIRVHKTWPKPAGISLAGKKVGLIGFGNIGQHLAKRLISCEMQVMAYDPYVEGKQGINEVERVIWPAQIETVDFLIFTCALTDSNRHMLNTDILEQCKTGMFVINVARGSLTEEKALIAALQSGKVAAAALDVFEQEPLPDNSPLRQMPQCILGSHNGSNTKDAVRRTSLQAMNKLFDFLRA